MTIEDRYQLLLTVESDVVHHLPKLRALAAGCEMVREFGVRAGASTIALLAGKPKAMSSYDVNPFALWPQLGSDALPETNFTFHQKDVLSVAPEQCDGLFVDTVHTYDQLFQELSIHSPTVRRWIAMHDTFTYGTYGEDGGPGINAAWQRVLKGWKVVYETEKCNGLTVLEP